MMFCVALSLVLYIIAVALITVICSLVLPIVFLIKLTPAMRQLIVSGTFAMVDILSMCIFFVPKVYLVYNNIAVVIKDSQSASNASQSQNRYGSSHSEVEQHNSSSIVNSSNTVTINYSENNKHKYSVAHDAKISPEIIIEEEIP